METPEQLERILAEQRTLQDQLHQINVHLDQMLAQMDARDRLWRGEDGFDG